jgi:hypothetical protein
MTTDRKAAAESGGGQSAGAGAITGSDGGRDVDVFLSSGGNPTGHVDGVNGKPVSDPASLVAQHELFGEGLQMMQGSGPPIKSVTIDRENELRSYLGMQLRSGTDH